LKSGELGITAEGPKEATNVTSAATFSPNLINITESDKNSTGDISTQNDAFKSATEMTSLHADNGKNTLSPQQASNTTEHQIRPLVMSEESINLLGLGSSRDMLSLSTESVEGRQEARRAVSQPSLTTLPEHKEESKLAPINRD
jgi:hypothetical protein